MGINGNGHRVMAFGSFEIDVTERLFLHNGKPVPIAPKFFDTLLVLVENAGHIFTLSDEADAAIWSFLESHAKP